MRASLATLVLLSACFHHPGTVDPIGDQVPPDVGVTEPVVVGENPASTPSLIPEVGEVRKTDDAVAFVWDDTFQTFDMADAVRGAKIERSEAGGWIVRRAGASGSAGGPAGMPRRTRARPMPSGVSMPAPAPMGAPMAESEPMALDVAYAAEESARKPASLAKRGGGASPAMQQPALRAGTTDDNAAFGEFLEFLDTWTDRPGVAGNHVPMDVSDRTFVKVVDGRGEPVPGARIAVRSADESPLWYGTTYGDGQATFYPNLVDAEGDLLVQAELDGRAASVHWDGRGETVQLVLDAPPTQAAVDLDVVFVIDTTGSMSDEIDRIKATLLQVTERVRGLDREVDLRYGAVLYRDIGDAYLTQHTPLTHDVAAFDALLKTISAGGGGDGPESLNQGLAVAVDEMEWRDEAAKLMFVVADAPPHMDYQDDTTYAVASLRALADGIRIHTVAASGLDDFGSLVFRQTAQLTRGDFVFIEYGSSAASAADHGVTGPVANNNLDAILFRKIEDEVNGWGVSASRLARR